MSLTPICDAIRAQRDAMAFYVGEGANHLYIHPELAAKICKEVADLGLLLYAEILALKTLYGMQVHEAPFMQPHATLLTIGPIK